MTAKKNNDQAQAEFVRALHDYKTEQPSCLSMKKGDVLQVLNRDASGWWDGVCNAKRGWFPSNYVAPITGEAHEKVTRCTCLERIRWRAEANRDFNS